MPAPPSYRMIPLIYPITSLLGVASLSLLPWYLSLSLSQIIPIRKENTHENIPFSHTPPATAPPPCSHHTQMTSLPTTENSVFMLPLKWPLSGPLVTALLPKSKTHAFVLSFFDLTIPSSWTWLLDQPICWFPSSLPAPICLASSIQLQKLGQGFPGGSVVKRLPANAGDTGSIPNPGRAHMSWSN